jgi:hypothetical protein
VNVPDFKRAPRWALIALLGLVLVGLLGLNDMGFFSSDKRDLRRLLGDAGAILIDDAEVTAWQPDPNHKPPAYYPRDADRLEGDAISGT